MELKSAFISQDILPHSSNQKLDNNDYETLITLLNGQKHQIEQISNIFQQNAQIRKVFCQGELLILQIKYDNNIANEVKTQLIDKLSLITNPLKLKHVKSRNWIVLSKLDNFIRLVTVFLWLMVSSFVLSIPIIIMRLVENYMISWFHRSYDCSNYKSILQDCKIPFLFHPTRSFTSISKYIINWMIIHISGINLVVTGTQNKQFYGNTAFLLTFTHSSAIDMFGIAYSCPVGQISLGKVDLFLTPFFSWLLIALGALPVDRKNRKQAVKALRLSSTRALKTNVDAIAISPEGTRSKTGLLIPFKKGPFYIWDDYRIPIVPSVIIGAYELCPPGQILSNCGKIYIDYLKPILPNEADSRDEMSDLLRKRILERILNASLDTGSSISWSEYLVTWICTLLTHFLTFALFRLVSYVINDVYKISGYWNSIGTFVLFLIFITLLLFYYVKLSVAFYNDNGEFLSPLRQNTGSNEEDDKKLK